jgi:SanA protein
VNRLTAALVVLLALGAGTTAGPWALIEYSSRPHIYDRPEAIKPATAGLVLGASRLARNYVANPFFRNRIEAAAALYKAGKVQYLIVSGNQAAGGRPRGGYDEPADLRAALIAEGVPAARIYRDYAGFRTLDSIVRAKEIFGQERVIVVSQPFHLSRALFLARWRGLDDDGFAAGDVPLRFGVRTYLREIAARAAAVFDLLRGTGPALSRRAGPARRGRADMKARLALLLLALGLGGASAPSLAPFLPQAAAPKFLEVLTPPDFIDRAVIEAFEKQSGQTVALDTYASPAEFAELSAERRYDLVALNGLALARRLSTFSRLDHSVLANARNVQPLISAKYAAYDRDGAHGVPFGWSAFGLLYDSDKVKEPPTTFAQAFGYGRDARRFADCGIVWPDARVQSFLAVWRLTGLDPARATATHVKNAAALLERTRGAALAFAAPDEVGALSKGAGCLGAGTAGEAAAVSARGGDGAPLIRFAYPREGATLTIYAYAIPANAASPLAAYQFLDALLAPENVRRDAALAGLNSAEDATDLEALKRLLPEPLLDPAVDATMQSEWKRLTSTK